MSDNYNVYVNDDTEPNVSVSADSDVSALVDDDSNVVLDVEEDAGALLNADINDEELVDVPIEETIGELGADHRRLLHRDAADQHPMSAITGLTDSLTGLQNTIDSGLISVETSVSDVTLLANGKNTVYHSSTMPTGGEYKVGDTWFNSSESYCMYKWDGSNWIREQFGNGAFANASIWNATIQDGAITNAKIEDATIENGKIKDATIESAKISSLNGDKITANSLTIGKMASDVTDAISAAGNTASNYITTISGRDGICVHDVNDTSNYVNLNSNGMGVFAGGSLTTSISSSGMNVYVNDTSVASFGSSGVNLYGNGYLGASITLSGVNLYAGGSLGASLTSSGMTLYASDTSIAYFGSTIRLGESKKNRIEISSSKVDFYNSSNAKILSVESVREWDSHLEIYRNYAKLSSSEQIQLYDDLYVNGEIQAEDVTAAGDIFASGTLYCDGVATFGSHIKPESSSNNCGTSSNPWSNCYVSTYFASTTEPSPHTQNYAVAWYKTSSNNYVLCRPSSSRKWKKDIEPISDAIADPKKLYDLRVVQFRYKDKDADDPNNTKYNPTALDVGFIAEEVAEAYPLGAVINEDGEPDDWFPRRIIPPMLALIQEQNKRIEELERRMS